MGKEETERMGLKIEERQCLKEKKIRIIGDRKNKECGR